MHERLFEMGRSLPSAPSPSTAVARDTYTKAGDKERETFTVESVSEGATTAQAELTEQGGRDSPDSTGQQGSTPDPQNILLRDYTVFFLYFSHCALIRACTSTLNQAA
jgi:hypothetical protein